VAERDLHASFLERSFNDDQQVIDIERLGEVIVGAAAQSFDG
jgi:hypothetical protein